MKKCMFLLLLFTAVLFVSCSEVLANPSKVYLSSVLGAMANSEEENKAPHMEVMTSPIYENTTPGMEAMASVIDGTWNVESGIYEMTLLNSVLGSGILISANPSEFTIRVTGPDSNGKYTILINNTGIALNWTVTEGPASLAPTGFSGQDKLTKVSETKYSYIYTNNDGFTTDISFNLLNNSTLLLTTESENPSINSTIYMEYTFKRVNNNDGGNNNDNNGNKSSGGGSGGCNAGPGVMALMLLFPVITITRRK